MEPARTPSLFGLLKASWRLVSRHDERQFRAMGDVRRELMRVVHSHMTDTEAVAVMGPVVRDDPAGGAATLSYVTETRDFYGGYIPDRAYRILIAATQQRPPDTADPNEAELFERERQLGWLPLDQAFRQLADTVPDLDALAARIQNEQGSRYILALQKLVGPRSSHPDPLIRSALALQIVSNYFSALRGEPSALDVSLPIWEYRHADPEAYARMLRR